MERCGQTNKEMIVLHPAPNSSPPPPHFQSGENPAAGWFHGCGAQREGETGSPLVLRDLPVKVWSLGGARQEAFLLFNYTDISKLLHVNMAENVYIKIIR